MAIIRILLLSLVMGFSAQASVQLSIGPYEPVIGWEQLHVSLDSDPGANDYQSPQTSADWAIPNGDRLNHSSNSTNRLLSPDYIQVFELPLPPIALLQPDYVEPLGRNHQWHLSASPCCARIGGWKDSNQLYQNLAQQRAFT